MNTLPPLSWAGRAPSCFLGLCLVYPALKKPPSIPFRGGFPPLYLSVSLPLLSSLPWLFYSCRIHSKLHGLALRTLPPLAPAQPVFQVTCCIKVLVTQSCLTLCDPMDYSLSGFSVRGVLQARMLE